MTPPVRAYVGLGSNLGRRRDHLRQGLGALAAHPRIEVLRTSGVWETEYVGPGRQDPYLNAVTEVRTDLVPPVLLAVCKAIERDAGRAPDGHLLPRPLDLDLLLMGGLVQADAVPLLPHPGTAERGFVLAPLAQLAPDLVLPDSGETVAALYAKIGRKSGPWLRLRRDLDLAPAGAAKEANALGALALHRR